MNWDYISHIYCRCPIQFQERWETVSKEFARVGITAERFSLNIVSNDKVKRQELAVDDFRACIQDAKEKGYKNCLIFEDDIIFEDKYLPLIDKVLEFIKNNEYHIMYLGGTFPEKPEIISDHIVRVKSLWCFQSLIVDQLAYDLILEALTNLYCEGDAVIAEKIQPLGKCYCVVPRIIYQREGYSYLQGKFLNYHEWQRDNDNWEFKQI